MQIMSQKGMLHPKWYTIYSRFYIYICNVVIVACDCKITSLQKFINPLLWSRGIVKCPSSVHFKSTGYISPTVLWLLLNLNVLYHMEVVIFGCSAFLLLHCIVRYGILCSVLKLLSCSISRYWLHTICITVHSV